MLTRRDMLIATMLGSVAGCGASISRDEAAAYDGNKFLLDVEPVGAISVAEAREAIQETTDLVLIGRIPAGEMKPWNEGRAAFFLSEAFALIDIDEDEHQHAEGHDHKNCPFCNRNKSKTESQAIVQFLDQNGQVIAIDARQLLPVKEGQLVVVQGTAKLDDLGTLVVSAKGIYLRR